MDINEFRCEKHCELIILDKIPLECYICGPFWYRRWNESKSHCSVLRNRVWLPLDGHFPRLWGLVTSFKIVSELKEPWTLDWKSLAWEKPCLGPWRSLALDWKSLAWALDWKSLALGLGLEELGLGLGLEEPCLRPWTGRAWLGPWTGKALPWALGCKSFTLVFLRLGINNLFTALRSFPPLVGISNKLSKRHWTGEACLPLKSLARVLDWKAWS